MAVAAVPLITSGGDLGRNQSRLRLVPGGGVEPPRAEARRILSPLRLPVPPSRLRGKCLSLQSSLRCRFCHPHDFPGSGAVRPNGTTTIFPAQCGCSVVKLFDLLVASGRPSERRPPAGRPSRYFPFAFFRLAFSSACDYFRPITPNVPARLLCGPAVKSHLTGTTLRSELPLEV